MGRQVVTQEGRKIRTIQDLETWSSTALPGFMNGEETQSLEIQNL